MSNPAYLLFHKDHPLHVRGVNSGAETATRELARALARKGNRVVVCAILPEGETECDGVSFWDLGESFDVSAALKRARNLGSYHLISAGRALPLSASRSEDACLTRTLICHDPSGSAAGLNNDILCKNVDGIICVSEAQKALFVEAGAEASKVHVIYNGVDHQVFTPGSSDGRNLKSIVFSGALVPHKGAHLLIEAFCDLKRRHSDLTLDIYGSSDLWGQGNYLNEAQLQKEIPGLTFHGATSQKIIASALKKAGLVVCPSIWFEALGLASLEAQASGCPVVVFNSGGLRETVVNGETGVLVNEITAQALSKGIESVITNPEKQKAMGARGAEHCRERFSWEKTAEGVTKLCEGYRAAQAPARKEKKLGIMSTWNQQCGLATYAKYLFSALEAGSFVVLAEDTAANRIGFDEEFVARCWKRESADIAALEAEIEKQDIGLLHLNFHDHHFFPHDSLYAMIDRLRSNGIQVVSHLHTTFTVDEKLREFLRHLDGVFVHTPENRLQVIAHGADPLKVWVIPHGVALKRRSGDEERRAIRKKLKITNEEKLIVSVGFVQPNKGVEAVIEAVAHLQHGRGIAARGYILGKVNEKLPHAVEYYRQLKLLAQKAGVSDRVIFTDRFLSDDEVNDFLGAADLVMMNYNSQYYEASGACSIAVGSGALVATSLAPQFAPFGDAVWHMTSGFPPGLTAEVLLGQDPTAREIVLENARRYAEQNEWGNILQKLLQFYSQISFVPKAAKKKISDTNIKEGKEMGVDNERRNEKRSNIKVLFQNRANTFTQRGGDTVVIERTIEGLKRHGVEVVVDLEGREDPSKYNLVHIFNFALPDLTRAFAERAHRAGVPFVVTTLSEDLPAFHNQSRAAAELLISYQEKGQNLEWFNAQKGKIASAPRSGKFDNAWTAQHATALITNGATESAVVRRDYPNAKKVFEVALGCEVASNPDPTLFTNKFGVRDFVLCVGRFESRKNQLMLLKALENSPLTVVLASGGFSYQPEYDRAVRNFKRKGQTLVVDRLSPEMLASCYAAAKVHVLPSWYELPGLVSLEAARYGCRVVVTENGTAPDYFGECAFYCDPGSPSSISNAVTAAFYAPTPNGLKECALKYSWEATGDATYAVYENVLGIKKEVVVENTARPMNEMISRVPNVETPSTSYTEAFENGDKAARAGDFAKAHEWFDRAERIDPRSSNALRASGAIWLAEGNSEKARGKFSSALAIDPNDLKAISGVGMCDVAEKRFTDAYPKFVRVLAQDIDQTAALINLITCAFATNQFNDLESVLLRYLEKHPGDRQMQYALAGCLLRKGDIAAAEGWLNKLSAQDGAFKGLSELRTAIDEAKAKLLSKQLTQSIAASTPPMAVQPLAQAVETQKIESPTSQAEQAKAQMEIEMRLSDLEDKKRRREIDEVKPGLAAILGRPEISPEQKERARILKAEVVVLEGEIEQASKIYDTVLEANPKSPRAMCGRGAILAHGDKWAEAKALFEAAKNSDDRCDVAYAGLGLCASRSGNNEEAWSLYNKALSINAENVRALYGVIELGYPMKRFSDVERALKNYLEMHPADLDFIYSLAGCFFAQGKYKEALDSIDNIILFNPQHPRALELREMIRTKTTNFNTASGAAAR